MEISKKEIEHIANLSRLNLQDGEATEYQEQLSAILQFIDKLNELDTANVAPTSHPLDLANVFRVDEVRASLPREVALSNAPDTKDGQFKVPPAIEG